MPIVDFNALAANFLTLLLLLSCWFYLFVVLVGIGGIAQLFFGVQPRRLEDLFWLFWTGWAFTIFFLQIWHLFLPVDRGAFFLISTIGLYGCFRQRQSLRSLECPQFPIRVLMAGFFILGLWLAQRTLFSELNFDSGLYHWASVRWNNTYPIVPGLGNLYAQLAFNSSYFLYVAMLEGARWRHSQDFANGVLLWVLCSQILISWVGLLNRGNKIRLSDVFMALLLLGVLFTKDVLYNLGSPSPDTAVAILAMILMVWLIRFFEDLQSCMENLRPALFFISVIVVLGITVKMNFLVYGGSIFAMTWFYYLRPSHRRDAFKKEVLLILILAACVLSLWMLRGVILSGYPLYPFAGFSLPVEWRVPQASVVNHANWIMAWARCPRIYHWSLILGKPGWFINGWWVWRLISPHAVMIPVFLFIANIIMIFFVYFRNSKGGISLKPYGIIFIPPLLSILFWLLTAPDPRFGSVFFWVLAVLSITFLIPCLREPRKGIGVYTLLFLIVNGLVYARIHQDTSLAKTGRQNGFIHSLIECLTFENKNFFWNQQPRLGSFPESIFKTYITRSGLILYVPTKGLLWDSPLPGTYFPHRNLRLRKSGDMRSGFMIDPKREDDDSVGFHREWVATK